MATATAYLHLRIPPQKKRLLESAAKAANNDNLTDYVLGSALRQAELDLLERRTFRLSGAAWAEFNQALEQPPRVLPALRRLAQRGDVFHRPA
jgi:uncharacterized protein (DUF1778 family)